MNNNIYPFFSDTIKLQLSSKLLYDEKRQRTIAIRKNAWCILDFVNGKKTLGEIFETVSYTYEISREQFNMFFSNLNEKGIILFSDILVDKPIETIEYCTPEVVSLLLTDKCNINCVYCYGDFKATNSNVMTLEVITSMFDNFKKMGTNYIELTGGEPLMHPQFIQVFEIACQTFKSVALLSNGVLFDDKIFDIIEKYKNKISIRISVDGYSPETNDQIRQIKGTLPKTIKTIKKLVEIRVRLEVTYMILYSNQNELDDFCLYMRELGVETIIVSAPESFNGGRSILFPDGKNISDRESSFYKNMDQVYKDVAIKHGDLIMSPKNRKRIEVGLDVFPNCGAGWKSFSIQADGDVIPCGLMNKTLVLGNIYKTDFPSIFISNHITNFLSKTELNRNREGCNDCKFNSFCAKCIYKILIVNKNFIDNGMPLCNVAINNNVTEELLTNIK